MKIVKVTYTTRPGFAEQNSSNIRTVMKDLQQAGHPGIFYHTCLSADGKTFIHTAFFKSGENQKILNALPAFTHFQEQLQAAGFEVPPKQEFLTLVGSSGSLFGSQEK